MDTLYTSGAMAVNYTLHFFGFIFFVAFTYEAFGDEQSNSVNVRCLLYPLAFSGLWQTYSLIVALVGTIIIVILDSYECKKKGAKNEH